MIKTKSVRERPAADDGVRVFIFGFDGRFGYEIFRDLILPELSFDEEAFLFRPIRMRLCRYLNGRDTWESFSEMYRRELCYRDAAYREIERYARLSVRMTVTFLDMCESPKRSLRKTIAEMCNCIMPGVDLVIE